MKKTRTICNVSSVECRCEFGIVNGSVFDFSTSDKMFVEHNGFSSVDRFGENHLIVKDKRGNSYVIDLVTLMIEHTERINSYQYPNLQFYIKTKPRIYRIVNYETGQTLVETESWLGRDFIGKFIVGSNNNILTLRKTTDANPVWEFRSNIFGTYINHWQEEKPHEIKKNLGVWNEQLIVQLTGGKFIGLDLNTGEFLWCMNEVKHNLTKQEIDFGFSEPDNPFLDEETGHIYMLQGEVLIDFDLTKLEATYSWSIRDLELETYPFIRQSKMHDGKIYFAARSHVNNDDDMVGIFDLEENRITWQHIFGFEKGTFIPYSQQNIHVNSRNLLVLDNKGLLHIFEK